MNSNHGAAETKTWVGVLPTIPHKIQKGKKKNVRPGQDTKSSRSHMSI